jgi:hypothetical protein
MGNHDDVIVTRTGGAGLSAANAAGESDVSVLIVFHGEARITRCGDYYDPTPMREQLKGQVPLATQ